MSRLRYNGLATGAAGSPVALSLGASLTNSATSVTFNAALTYQNGTAVPTIAAPDFLFLSILDATGSFVTEVVYLTAYTSGATTGTITRAQEGYTGVTHASGDKIVHAATSFDYSRDRRWTPGAGETSIDEFNDETLDAAWAQVNGTNATSGNISWLESGDVLSMKNAGADGAAWHGMVRAVGTAPVTGDAFITCVSLQASLANDSVIGIVLTTSATHGSGEQILGSVRISTAGFQSTIYDISGWAGIASFTGTADLVFRGAIYVRLVYLGSNNWRCDYSTDGVQWILGGATITKTMTPTHVGFMSSSYTSAIKHIASWEFLRRVSGVS